jgi:hypothetical protein
LAIDEMGVKYDSLRGDWCFKEVGEPYGLGVWKCIKRGWDGFAHHMCYEEGDGSKVLFWHDMWCGELPLKIIFLELFTIACGKGCVGREEYAVSNWYHSL